MKRLAEFDERGVWQGTEPLDAIANQEVVILSVQWVEGKFGKAAILDVTTPDGKRKRVRTSSAVLVTLLKTADDMQAFPLAATFTRKGRYWMAQ